MDFDWDKQKEKVEEWDDLFSSLEKLLSDKKEVEITAPLYTMVHTEPHVFKKSRIKSIRFDIGKFVGRYLGLKIENEDGVSEVVCYPQFELKTEGRIKDIVLILMFIKDNVKNSKKKTAETTIV